MGRTNQDINLSQYSLKYGDDQFVAVEKNGSTLFRLHDTVEVLPDSHGKIAVGIDHHGFGEVVDIRPDTFGRFFGVLLPDGSFAYLTEHQMRMPSGH